jgi:hypothetical protein
LLLLAPAGTGDSDWPAARWLQLEQAVQQQLTGGRIQWLRTGSPLQQAAQIASADGLVSSSAVATALGRYSGVAVIELEDLGQGASLSVLPLEPVLQALGLS